jgi:hypothetical protein
MQRISRLTCVAVLGAALAASAAGRAVAQDQVPRAPIRDPEHRVQIYVRSWKELRNRNIVMQTYDYSCGAAALATILRYYWNDPGDEHQIINAILKTLTFDEAKDRMDHGLSITDLRHGAVQLGYLSTIGAMSFQQLAQARVPLVVPLRIKDYDHFVVYRGIADGRVYLADPIRGNVRPTVAEFCQQWQKNAVLVVAKPGAMPPMQSWLSIRVDEVCVGDMTNQFLRRQLPQGAIPARSPKD